MMPPFGTKKLIHMLLSHGAIFLVKSTFWIDKRKSLLHQLSHIDSKMAY